MRQGNVIRLSVILFMGMSTTSPFGQTPHPQADTPSWAHPRLHSACWDMVNKWVVLGGYWNAILLPSKWSCKGYVFTPVWLSTGASASVHAGIPPPPLEQAPPREQAPPKSRHPLEQAPPRAGTPLEQAPTLPEQAPCSRHPPRSSPLPPADGFCCGQYWNGIPTGIIIIIIIII